jgi:hypothetical protein
VCGQRLRAKRLYEARPGVGGDWSLGGDRGCEASWEAERKSSEPAGQRDNSAGAMRKQDWIGGGTHQARQRAR